MPAPSNPVRAVEWRLENKIHNLLLQSLGGNSLTIQGRNKIIQSNKTKWERADESKTNAYKFDRKIYMLLLFALGNSTFKNAKKKEKKIVEKLCRQAKPKRKTGPKQGTRFSIEHRKNLSKSLRIFYNTLDGRPLGPQPQISGDRWCHDYQKWRLSVLRRDNHICQHCAATRSVKLVAHHIKPYKRFPDLRYEVDNGKTLCVSCHARLEMQIRLATLFLKQLRERKCPIQ
jgi:hypothetical protein